MKVSQAREGISGTLTGIPSVKHERGTTSCTHKIVESFAMDAIEVAGFPHG